MVSVGSIITVLLAAVIAIAISPLFQNWRQQAGSDVTGLASSEPLASAPPAVQNELGTPKLFVEPLLGIRGEPRTPRTSPARTGHRCCCDNQGFVAWDGIVSG
jgi:hypothetical protein